MDPDDPRDEHPEDEPPVPRDAPQPPVPDDDPFAFAPDERDVAGDRDADPGHGGASADDPGSATRSDDPLGVVDPTTVREEAARTAQAVGARWLVVAIVAFLVITGISTLTGGHGKGGDGQVQAGERLPVFAAPLATQPKLAKDDVNLATGDGQGAAGKTAACSIANPSVVTSCALLKRGPLVLATFSSGVDACVRSVDELDGLRRRYPSVQTLAVATLAEHDRTATLVRDRRWTLPVAYDRDAELSKRIGGTVCPLLLFVRQDGTVAQRLVGTLRSGEIATAMARLAADPASAAPPAGTTTSDAPASGR